MARSTSKIRYALISLTLILLGMASSASAGQTGPRNILVLLSYHMSLPWTQSFLQGLQEAQIRYGDRLHLYVENMESIRLRESLSDEEWADYLRKKYHAIHFDAAIAESAKASEFLSAWGEKTLGKIPRIHYSLKQNGADAKTLTLQVQMNDCVLKTFELALAQNPKAKRVVFVDGQSESSQPILTLLQPLLANHPELELVIIREFSIESLLHEVASQPREAIVFYTLVFHDVTGRPLYPKQVLKELVAVSPAPVYTFWASLMDSGVVGGHMIDGAKTARQMVQAAFDALEEGEFKKDYDTLTSIVDWNALCRWDIAPALIPAEATVINQPPPLLQSHFRPIMTTAGIVVVLFLLLILFWLIKLAALNKKLKEANEQVILARDEAEKLARTDILTGLNNRRAFFEKGAQVFLEAKRLEKPLATLLLDIDHFKTVNDTYGHTIGDEAIKAFAKVLTDSSRDMDIVARFGGEEFAVITPFTDCRGAVNVAERIRRETEAGAFRLDGHAVRFTVSIGVFCTKPGLGSPLTINEYIKYADDALYQAKKSGRNRVVLYEAPSAEPH